MNLAYPFKTDPLRFEGVRPIQIWGLRLFYCLMAAFVATDAWRELLTHQGPWDPLHAVAVCKNSQVHFLPGQGPTPGAFMQVPCEGSGHPFDQSAIFPRI